VNLGGPHVRGHTLGAEAPVFCSFERPKAEALGYPEADTDSSGSYWRHSFFGTAIDSFGDGDESPPMGGCAMNSHEAKILAEMELARNSR